MCSGPGAGVGLAIYRAFPRFRTGGKSCFHKEFVSAKCIRFSKLWQICIRRNTQVSHTFANMTRISQAFRRRFGKHSRKYGFEEFRNISQAFAIHGFASFCKLSQGFANGLSQGFASAKIMVFRKDSQWALC